MARMVAAACVAGLACAAALSAAAEPAPQVRQAVLDIISYTRWPEPATPIRLCLVGRSDYVRDFFGHSLHAGGTAVRPRTTLGSNQALGEECDVAYLGPMPPVERDEIVARLAARPVLTIGEPTPGCRETTMFCLRVVAEAVTFAINRPAIGRAGLRVNPRVLLLGQRSAGS